MIPADVVSDLVPFAHVTNVDRSVAFYERLGFEMLHEARHRPWPPDVGPDRQLEVTEPDGYVLMLAEIEGERVGVLPDR